MSPASGQTDLETFPQPPEGVYTHYTRRRTSTTRLDSVVDLADTLTFPDLMSSTAGNRGPKPSSFSGDVNEENPEQFWREVEEYLSGETETAKCARFQNLLRARSAADVWYKQLSEEVRASWSRLKGAYDKEFVALPKPQHQHQHRPQRPSPQCRRSKRSRSRGNNSRNSSQDRR